MSKAGEALSAWAAKNRAWADGPEVLLNDIRKTLRHLRDNGGEDGYEALKELQEGINVQPDAWFIRDREGDEWGDKVLVCCQVILDNVPTEEMLEGYAHLFDTLDSARFQLRLLLIDSHGSLREVDLFKRVYAQEPRKVVQA